MILHCSIYTPFYVRTISAAEGVSNIFLQKNIFPMAHASPTCTGVSHLLQNVVNNISKSKLLDCRDRYLVWCPAIRLELGCSDELRPNWPGTVNSLCPKTCGLCSTASNVSRQCKYTYLVAPPPKRAALYVHMTTWLRQLKHLR